MRFVCLAAYVVFSLGSAMAGGVLVLGDGRTASDPAIPQSAGWGDSMAMFFKPGVTFTNLAMVDGSVEATLNSAAFARVTMDRDPYVFFGFGQGDADRHTEIDVFRQQVLKVVESCRAKNRTPVLVTPPSFPWNDPAMDAALANPIVRSSADVSAYAQVIRDIATQQKVLLLDPAAALPDAYRLTGGKGMALLHPPLPGAAPVLNTPRNPFYFSREGADALAHWLVIMMRRSGDTNLVNLLRSEDGPPDASYRMVWNDEFDGTELNSTNWVHRYTGPRKGGFNDPDCVRLDGKGHLVIDVKRVGPIYHSGMIGTQEKKWFKFGYFECRATLPRQPGYWGAFWLSGYNISDPEKGAGTVDDTRNNGVEIDIMESFYDQGDTYLAALNWNGYGHTRKSVPHLVFVPELRKTEWHVFGVDWRPDGYTFYVDGRRTWETTLAPSHAQEEIVLSAEVGKWAGDIKKAQLPQRIMFDWVRVWKKDPVAIAQP